MARLPHGLFVRGVHCGALRKWNFTFYLFMKASNHGLDLLIIGSPRYVDILALASNPRGNQSYRNPRKQRRWSEPLAEPLP